MSDPSLQDVPLNKADLTPFTDTNSWGGADRFDVGGHLLNRELSRHNQAVTVKVEMSNQGQAKNFARTVGNNTYTTPAPISTQSAQDSTN